MLRKTAATWIWGLCLVWSGCAAPPGPGIVAPEQECRWPDALGAPTESTTVQYRLIGMLNDPDDLYTPGTWRRLVDFFAGPEPMAFRQPHAVAVAEDGAVFVSDTVTGQVVLIRRDGTAPILIGGPTGRLGSPVGLAVGKDGAVFVTDSSAAMVYRLDRRRMAWSPWAPTGVFERPTGIAVHPKTGEVYVVDSKAHCVVVLNDEGAEVRRIGGRGLAPGEFNFPVGIAFTPEGEWFVADTLNFRLQRFGADDQPLEVWPGAAEGPGVFATIKAVAVDDLGRVYVVDSADDAVKVFGPDGTFLIRLGGTGTAPGEWWLPSDVTTDGAGRLIVTDTHNKRLQFIERLR